MKVGTPIEFDHTVKFNWKSVHFFDWNKSGDYIVYFDDYFEEVYYCANETVFYKEDMKEPFMYAHEITAFCEYPENIYPNNLPRQPKLYEIK